MTEELLIKLADKLGVTAECLWGVLLRQATIQGVISIVLILVIVAAITGAWLFIRHKAADWNDDTVAIATVAWAAVSLLAVLFACSLAYDSAIALASPEYWALSQLLPK